MGRIQFHPSLQFENDIKSPFDTVPDYLDLEKDYQRLIMKLYGYSGLPSSNEAQIDSSKHPENS